MSITRDFDVVSKRDGQFRSNVTVRELRIVFLRQAVRVGCTKELVFTE
jgi:hypothetical protein